MKKLLSVLLFILLTACACLFTGCGNKKEIESSIWLDRYEEQIISVESCNANEYKWASSDKNIVTVENGKLVAQGEGSAVVTGESSTLKVIYNIKVNDSGAMPHIVFDNVISYVNVEKPVSLKIYYNEKEIEGTFDYQLSVKNSSMASVNETKVTGLVEGETTITAKTTYKGLDLSTKKNLIIKPNTYIESSINNVSLLACNNKKVNQKQLSFEVVENGEIQENPRLSYSVQGDDCVTFENNTIIAKSIGNAVVKASLVSNASVYCEFNVAVNEAFVADSFTNFGKNQGATLETIDQVVYGKKASLKYTTGTLTYDYRGWSNMWDHRIQNNGWGGDLIEKYRGGYRYFTYDIYIPTIDMFLIGIGNTTTWYVTVDTPIRADWIKILDENGNLINRIKTNQWITICYDLYGIVYNYPDAGSNFFLTINSSNATMYLANVGYVFDDSKIKNSPTYQYEEDVTITNNNEFTKNVSTDTYYAIYGSEKDGVANSYKYTGNTDYLNHTLVTLSSLGNSRSQIKEYLYDKGRYLVFDLYLDSDEAGLYFAVDERQTEQRFTISVTDVSKVSWIHVVRDNKLQYSFEKGVWQTVWVDFADICSTSTSKQFAIEFGLMGNKDAYINNLRYYQNNNSMPTEYVEGYAPLGVKVINESKAEVGNGEGDFIGLVHYTNVANDNGGYLYFQEIQNNKKPMAFFSEKYKYVSFDFYLTNNVTSIAFFSKTARSTIKFEHSFSMNIDTDTTIPSWISITDNEGNSVTKIATSKWYKLTAYIEYISGSTSCDVGFYALGTGTPEVYMTSPSYSKLSTTLDFVPDTQGTNNCDVIYSTDEDFVGTVKYINWNNSDRDGVYFTKILNKEFYNGNYKYLTFDFYLTDSVNTVVFFSWITNEGKGLQYQKTISMGLKYKPQDDNKTSQHFYFFNASGESVCQLVRGQWYTVCMELEYPQTIDWQHVFFAARGSSQNGIAYLRNYRQSNDLPYTWQDPGFDGSVTAKPLGFNGVKESSSDNITVQQTVKDSLDCIKAEGRGKIYFEDVMSSSTEYGDFFSSNYEYILFDVYYEGGNGFYLQTKYHAIWHNFTICDSLDNKLGTKKYFEIFDANGQNVTTVSTGAWYTIKIFVAKDLNHASEVCYSLQDSSSIVYFKNLRFSK